MTDNLEDLVLKEARRQGYQPNQHAMRQAAIDLAGSVMTGGLIVIPGLGAISPADFTRSLRDRMPESFAGIDDKQPAKSAGNMTESMRAEIAASRKQATPADWNKVRGKYAAGTVTAQHMKEREHAAIRRQGN